MNVENIQPYPFGKLDNWEGKYISLDDAPAGQIEVSDVEKVLYYGDTGEGWEGSNTPLSKAGQHTTRCCSPPACRTPTATASLRLFRPALTRWVGRWSRGRDPSCRGFVGRGGSAWVCGPQDWRTGWPCGWLTQSTGGRG